ncbi:MAG TPA: hypothetical protein VJA27_01915 [Patescibacteria group bacterium]|nr:hypothetical protein [Patescibacteria group bacterium]
MSLIITIATGDGIVLAVDSALTQTKAGSIELTLSQFPKVAPVSFLHSGISFAGNLLIGPPDHQVYISKWLKEFINNSQADSFTKFATDLVDALNSEERQMEQLRVFNMAGWVQVQDTNGTVKLVPRIFETSNLDKQYKWTSLIPDDFVNDVIKWREGEKTKYPIRICTAGLPKGYASWISLHGTKQHSEFIKSQVPFPDITAVAEYARFLIKSIADLYQIARQPKVVDEPIETLVLFPESKNMISMRY